MTGHGTWKLAAFQYYLVSKPIKPTTFSLQCCNLIWTTYPSNKHPDFIHSNGEELASGFPFPPYNCSRSYLWCGCGSGSGSGSGRWEWEWVWGVNTGNGGGINGRTPSGSSVPNLNEAYTALQTWKSAITDDPLRILDNWVGSNVCSYKGVFCADPQDKMSASTGPVVAGIDLNHANLKGTLVNELSFLTDMSLIHLNSNRFSGKIPDTLRVLSSLQELDLSNNQFSGPFPRVTLYLPSLVYLDLRYNSFSGSIPEELFNKKLDAIFLNNNQFEGELPQNLGNSPASVINLANNKFSGNIPGSFGVIGSKLKEILFLNNQLTGCIPEEVGLFTEMQVLDVSYNSLMGHLPDTISCMQDVEILNFAHNKLSGVLPDLICSLRSLVNLTVSYNFFSGFSQECFKLLSGNVGFDFSLNCIPGRDMQRPQPDCSVIPGGELNCLRIPARPLVCASFTVASKNTVSSSSSP
ncbi:Leucine-rich repeat family protein / extensin family protein [Quillaja saponaria]|uniref:Cell wall hydroxyproline-rich glycoprotein n=1 Tax=Quillaja saponaria TaxID=32244 RepID=A0AAD7M488_QUISA|nr:Leucine-rich repeat family protein / extensin family protein [Quillaja saponaria]